MERGRRAHADLRGALVREVKRLALGRAHAPLPDDDHVALTRRKVEPMVRGLFSCAEHDAVLAVLERSVVFLTTANIERVLTEHANDKSAWDLANIYLVSVGATLLGDDAQHLVGISEGTTCFVSAEYFVEDAPFADFLVHEAAHVFHNCKRKTVGLRATRRREWLLEIEYRKRETFAYSCEAYARVLERAASATERRALADAFAATARFSDDRVDAEEVGSIVREASAARNGWKAILSRCAAAPPRSALSMVRESMAATMTRET
jgi:hypothetical protein